MSVFFFFDDLKEDYARGVKRIAEKIGIETVPELVQKVVIKVPLRLRHRKNATFVSMDFHVFQQSGGHLELIILIFLL